MSELKPVNCGCGGEAKVDWTVINGAYMAGVVCQKCGTKTASFYDRHAKDKVITASVAAWNRAMGAELRGSCEVLRGSEETAYWTYQFDNGTFVCSACGYVSEIETDECPSCGSRMVDHE